MIFRDKLNVLRTDTAQETQAKFYYQYVEKLQNPEFFSEELSTTPSINYKAL